MKDPKFRFLFMCLVGIYLIGLAPQFCERMEKKKYRKPNYPRGYIPTRTNLGPVNKAIPFDKDSTLELDEDELYEQYDKYRN